MLNEQTENVENVVNAPPKVSKPRKSKVFPIAFTLINRGDRFVVRTAEAVKISNTEAVLLNSGKIVKFEATKVVKVRKG